MDYNEVLQRARERIGPKCKVCPECNGLGCGNTMPGPGSKAPGNGANDNWRAWRRWCLNMDTIAPNTPVDTSLALLGRTFSLPVIAAPIGSLRAQFNPGDDIRDYNACAAAAAAQTGIAASFGDGLDARVFPHGCALSKQYGGIVLPVINPLSMDTIKANLDLANAAGPFAVSVVIDSAGLPHLKAASPEAGSKTVAELRELCDYAQMPMILKGIMTVRGAQKAAEAGAAAIVVSNHGGRVLPGAAVLAVLPGAGEARPMLVGMVREVTGHTARVQTLLNSELQISCRYEASGAVGFLNVSSGEAEPDDDLVPVGYLPTQDYLIGNLMVSTGYEQHLPSGIPIGRLADIGRSNTPFNGRLYRTVKLRPLADYNLLKFVVLAVSTSPAKME